MRHNNLKGTLILLVTAIIWGFAFVAQSHTVSVPPMLVNCLRSVISVAFLTVLYRIINRKSKKPFIPTEPSERKLMFRGGIICGVCFTVAANLQQAGISLYPKEAPVEAHSGFLTALYVVIVPIISIVIRKKISPILWVSVGMALIGFFMLSLYGGIGSFYVGDAVILVCAFAFSMQIIVIDIYVSVVDSVKLSLMQFCICAILSGILSAIFEHNAIDLNALRDCLLPIVYLGLLSSGVAYTLQMVGQRYAEPAVASITMSLESVFAALGGWLISGKSLKGNEIIGCAVVFAAIIIAQLPDILRAKRKKEENS